SLHVVCVCILFTACPSLDTYTLSLHAALPICVHELRLRHGIEEHLTKREQLHAHGLVVEQRADRVLHPRVGDQNPQRREARAERSEEHTSELQSHLNLVCRLLLEKKKKPTS